MMQIIRKVGLKIMLSKSLSDVKVVGVVGANGVAKKATDVDWEKVLKVLYSDKKEQFITALEKVLEDEKQSAISASDAFEREIKSQDAEDYEDVFDDDNAEFEKEWDGFYDDEFEVPEDAIPVEEVFDELKSNDTGGVDVYSNTGDEFEAEWSAFDDIPKAAGISDKSNVINISLDVGSLKAKQVKIEVQFE